MPKTLPISPRVRTEILKRYAQGHRPRAIALALSKHGITNKQITRLCNRAGLSKMRKQAEEIKAETVQEVLQQLRREGVPKAAKMLKTMFDTAATDAEELATANDLVESAGDLVAVQRAKMLHQTRSLDLLGVNGDQPAQSPMAAIGLIYARPLGPAPSAEINVTPPSTDLPNASSDCFEEEPKGDSN